MTCVCTLNNKRFHGVYETGKKYNFGVLKKSGATWPVKNKNWDLWWFPREKRFHWVRHSWGYARNFLFLDWRRVGCPTALKSKVFSGHAFAGFFPGSLLVLSMGAAELQSLDLGIKPRITSFEFLIASNKTHKTPPEESPLFWNQICRRWVLCALILEIFF